MLDRRNRGSVAQPVLDLASWHSVFMRKELDVTALSVRNYPSVTEEMIGLAACLSCFRHCAIARSL